MPEDWQWPESHNEQTDILPPISSGGRQAAVTAVTERISPGGTYSGGQHEEVPAAEVTDSFVRPVPEPPRKRGRAKLRRAGIITGAAVGALAALYGADLLVNHGDLPRGVSIAGVAVGGMDPEAARELLHERLQPRLTQPIRIIAGDVRTQLDPERAGLSLDWEETLRQVGEQSLNPITRITSLFTTNEIGVATEAEPKQLESAMAELSEEINRKPVQGDIRFEGTKPVPVLPEQGQQLELAAATDLVLSQWLADHPIRLPVTVTPVATSEKAVRTALHEIAEPAVSGPVTVHGDGKDAILDPAEIAKALSFEPAEDGSLTPKIDRKKIIDSLELESTEKRGRDASFVFHGGKPSVKPGEPGKKIDWTKTLKPLPDVLRRENNRELDVVYTEKQPKLTTKEAKNLGITEVIGEFTTTGFAPDSGVNIRLVAEEVQGAVVLPGETFSLNGYTGIRGREQGYIPAGIIMNGVPAVGIGGGISQFATTLYNAAYFAGMKDVAHTPHSYYISRYPEAREATVFMRQDGTSILDVKFANPYSTGVVIQTIWTPSSITVKLWGTKHVTVESITSERSDFTEPGVRHVSDPECIPTSGQRGFTVSNTRIIHDADTGEVISRRTYTVVYDPVPKVICE